MNGHQYLDIARRQEGIERLLDWVRGGAALQSLIEQYPDLTFEELEGEVGSLVHKATPTQRIDLHFKLALLRSLRYSVATSKHCLILGAVNGVRELYEGQRLLHQTPVSET